MSKKENLREKYDIRKSAEHRLENIFFDMAVDLTEEEWKDYFRSYAGRLISFKTMLNRLEFEAEFLLAQSERMNITENKEYLQAVKEYFEKINGNNKS